MAKERIEEIRSFYDIKGLDEQISELDEKMEEMITGAEIEKRAFTKVEEKKFNEIEEEKNRLKKIIETINERRAAENHVTVSTETGKIIDNKINNEYRALENVILPSEKMEKRSYKDNSSSMDFGKLIRGMAGKGWSGALKEQEHFRAMQSVENKVLVPQSLADKIIDVARTKSAIFGNIPVIEMENNNLTIAVQTKDATANFVDEGELIPESDAIFKPVTLEGKTLAIFIPVSEQLLDSAENLSNQLLNSSAAAIGLALDKALLYGKGAVESKPTEIKGISEYTEINKITHTGAASYDLLIKGLRAAKSSNIEPTNIAYNTNLSMDLSMLKDTQGQYINMPKVLENYYISESNNIKENEAYIYDMNSLILGIQKGITIEWGHSQDMFRKIQKGLRIYLRADLGVVNPKGITQATLQQA